MLLCILLSEMVAYKNKSIKDIFSYSNGRGVLTNSNWHILQAFVNVHVTLKMFLKAIVSHLTFSSAAEVLEVLLKRFSWRISCRTRWTLSTRSHPNLWECTSRSTCRVYNLILTDRTHQILYHTTFKRMSHKYSIKHVHIMIYTKMWKMKNVKKRHSWMTNNKKFSAYWQNMKGSHICKSAKWMNVM